jgi:hypothetical protein
MFSLPYSGGIALLLLVLVAAYPLLNRICRCVVLDFLTLSPPVFVTGQHINPGQPTHSPPVAGAGGETG